MSSRKWIIRGAVVSLLVGAAIARAGFNDGMGNNISSSADALKVARSLSGKVLVCTGEKTGGLLKVSGVKDAAGHDALLIDSSGRPGATAGDEFLMDLHLEGGGTEAHMTYGNEGLATNGSETAIFDLTFKNNPPDPKCAGGKTAVTFLGNRTVPAATNEPGQCCLTDQPGKPD